MQSTVSFKMPLFQYTCVQISHSIMWNKGFVYVQLLFSCFFPPPLISIPVG